MLFAIQAFDKPGAAGLRDQLRPAHLEHMARIADAIRIAGPQLSDDGATMIGSLIIADFTDRAALDAWLADEPFVQGGLYAEVRIQRFRKVFPAAE
jgi:uncharacterized protein YciI